VHLPLRALLVLAAVGLALPSTGWAQGKIQRVGVLTFDKAQDADWFLHFFRESLADRGWVEGKNLAFEYRNSNNDPSKFAAPAAELVQLKVDILLPVGPPAVRAAFGATHEIPIVAHDLETDPVAAGYARAYNRPGGNLTGLFLDSPELAAKWLELLKVAVPGLSHAVVLWDTTSGPVHLDAVKKMAPSFSIKLQVVEIHTPTDIDKARSQFRKRPQALIVLPSPMMYFESARLAALAKRLRLPAMSMFRPFVEAGGMFAYGPDILVTWERMAVLVDKVLNGTKPGDIPIERPVKFEFLVNRKAAKAIGLTVPDILLTRADEVIR